MSNTLVEKERPTTVTILVDRELRDRLERAAAAHERSLGGEVRALLRRYLSDAAKEEETS
jgi:plasmid stability protein